MRLEFSPYVQTLAFTIELSSGADRYTVAVSPAGEMQATPGAGTVHGITALR